MRLKKVMAEDLDCCLGAIAASIPDRGHGYARFVGSS